MGNDIKSLSVVHMKKVYASVVIHLKNYVLRYFSILFLIIALEGCSSFSDLGTIIKQNDLTNIYLEKGEYQILEKMSRQNLSFDKLSVEIQKNNIIKLSETPSKNTFDAISGEAIIMNISNEDFLVRNELKIVEPKEYTISTVGNKTEKEYLIIKK